MFSAKKKNSESEAVPQIVYFEKCMPGIEYIYAGNYFCWISPLDKYIKDIDLTQPQEERKVKKIPYE